MALAFLGMVIVMMTKSVLVINCGSSSVKFAVFNIADENLLCSGQVSALNSPQSFLRSSINGLETIRPLPNASHAGALESILSLLQESKLFHSIQAVGHRVVHGGANCSEPMLIDAATEAVIATNSEFAPLHNPANLEGIRAIKLLAPALPQVAVFDTAFHSTLPPVSYRYAVPVEWFEQHGIRRYGFHGINHHYIANQVSTLLPTQSQHLVVSAHLGNGCSVCAIKDGKSVDTSMGFTPLEGLVMGTRCGDLDAGLLEFLCEKLNLNIQDLTTTLNKQCGLKGLSGHSEDMRTLLRLSEAGDCNATLAIELFCYRLAKYIASYMVPLGGVPIIVFTGGIGEHAPLIRQRALEWLAPLGFQLDKQANERKQEGVRRISVKSSPPIYVIPANEEWMIAQQTQNLLFPTTPIKQGAHH